MKILNVIFTLIFISYCCVKCSVNNIIGINNNGDMVYNDSSYHRIDSDDRYEINGKGVLVGRYFNDIFF